MSGLNKIFFLGNLGADPEMRYTQQGTAVCNMRVACNEKWSNDQGQQERTTWMRVVAWGRIAETCSEYLQKGSQVLVEGRLQNREWEDKEGIKRQITEIVATTVKFLGRSKEERSDTEKASEPVSTDNDDIPF